MVFKTGFISFLSCLLLLNGTYLTATNLINTPGNFEVSNDYVYTPVGPNDSVIEVASNDVTIDFFQFTMSQDPTTLSTICNGIVINPGYSNITIQNINIEAFTGNGITIGAGCSNIIIESIVTTSCDTRSITLNGLPTAPITNIEITQCQAIGCGQGAASDYIMSFSECKRLQVTNLSLDGCGINSNNNISAVMLFDVCCSQFENIVVSDCTGNSILRGFDMTNATVSTFNNCTVQGGTVSTGGTNVAFDLQNSCSNLAFTNCLAFSQVATGAGSFGIGYRLQTGNDFNFLDSCAATSPSGDTAIGFEVLSNSNEFSQCKTSAGNSSSGAVTGFALSSATGTKLFNCVSGDHTSSSSNATGYNFTNCTDCFTQGCLAANIAGTNNAHTFGFVLNSGSGNAFTQNISSRNGSSSNTGNQFSGFNSDFYTIVSLSSILTGLNSVTAPWTNIGLL